MLRRLGIQTAPLKQGLCGMWYPAFDFWMIVVICILLNGFASQAEDPRFDIALGNQVGDPLVVLPLGKAAVKEDPAQLALPVADFQYVRVNDDNQCSGCRGGSAPVGFDFGCIVLSHPLLAATPATS